MTMETRNERTFLLGENLSQTDIWRNKAEGEKITFDLSLFSNRK